MAGDKDKKGSGDQKGGNDGKRGRDDRIKRPRDNVHGNNNNTNSTGPRSPNSEKQ